MALEYRFCPVCAKPLEERAVFGTKRKACPDPACGFVLFLEPKVVAVVLIEHAGQILLECRAVDPAKGRWSFPSGYVDRYEKVETAALREVKEETNLEVALKGLIGVYSEKGNPIILIVYRAEVTGEIGVMTGQADEVAELRFFDPANVPELAFPFDQRILADWLALRG